MERKIKAKLAQEGIIISEKRISRLVQELNLYTTQKLSREIRKQNKLREYPNKLDRKFDWDEPNQA